MFQFLLRVKALHRLGFGRPFRIIFIVIFAGALLAGVVYAFAVFSALNQRNQVPHVQPHSTH